MSEHELRIGIIPHQVILKWDDTPDQQWCVTHLHSGLRVDCAVRLTVDHIATAIDLGYTQPVVGDVTEASLREVLFKMMLEHEYLHSMLSNAVRGVESLVLFRKATNARKGDGAEWWEEQLVTEFQRYLNTGEIHGYLRSIEWAQPGLGSLTGGLAWLADVTYRNLYGINHPRYTEALDNEHTEV